MRLIYEHMIRKKKFFLEIKIRFFGGLSLFFEKGETHKPQIEEKIQVSIVAVFPRKFSSTQHFRNFASSFYILFSSSRASSSPSSYSKGSGHSSHISIHDIHLVPI